MISLLEHLDSLEVKYPKFIRNLLDKLLHNIDEGQLPDDWKPNPSTVVKNED